MIGDPVVCPAEGQAGGSIGGGGSAAVAQVGEVDDRLVAVGRLLRRRGVAGGQDGLEGPVGGDRGRIGAHRGQRVVRGQLAETDVGKGLLVGEVQVVGSAVDDTERITATAAVGADPVPAGGAELRIGQPAVAAAPEPAGLRAGAARPFDERVVVVVHDDVRLACGADRIHDGRDADGEGGIRLDRERACHGHGGDPQADQGHESEPPERWCRVHSLSVPRARSPGA